MRWEICFNLCILRMLSYALDLHRHRQDISRQSGQHAELCARTSQTKPGAELPPTRQQAAPSSEEDFGLLMYLAHVLYAPLYLAGPIITFHDFTWQLKRGSLPVGTEVSLCQCTRQSSAELANFRILPAERAPVNGCSLATGCMLWGAPCGRLGMLGVAHTLPLF